MGIGESESKENKLLRSKLLTQGVYDPKTYDFDESFQPYNPEEPRSVHTTFEMLDYLHRHPETELDAKVLGLDKNLKWKQKKIEKASFIESFQRKEDEKLVKLHESFSGSNNVFAQDYSPNAGVGFGVGQDFTPLLGGPFYKNLYYYQDYIRMHSECFYALNHDPLAKAIVQITRDFVVGNGYEVQCDLESEYGKIAMAAWKAFEEVNDLQHQIDQACEELCWAGEVMFWKLPNQQDKITFGLRPGDSVPKGIIPRVRMIDVSNIVEIVTYPEDVTRALMYVWLTPTQWQMFTGGLGVGIPQNVNPIQPTLKFIYRTIAADQMLHFKVNTTVGEKRGRSDFFPVLSYLKRMRDIVDYQLVALQKAAAWALDTEIDGNQEDIDNYIQNQASLGTVAPAGSEFVHSKAIKRNYVANQGASNINSDAFSIGLSMIAAGVQIPVSYFGTHLSGGQTKASALVATEPVAKKMEKRREVLKRIIKKLWAYCMECAQIPGVDCDVIFPEIITQDRSNKLKDLMIAESQNWISPERAATMAAKELQIQNYSYQKELENFKKQLPELPLPLTKPGQKQPAQGGGAPSAADSQTPGVNGLTSEDKKDIRFNDTHF